MKKNLMKSILAALLILSAVFPSSSATMIQPCWSYVSTVGGSIDISPLSIATVSGCGSAASLQVTKTVCKVNIQQLKNRKWTTLNTWTATSNMRFASVSKKYWAVPHGYSYRLYVELQAYNGTKLLETGSSIVDYGYYK